MPTSKNQTPSKNTNAKARATGTPNSVGKPQTRAVTVKWPSGSQNFMGPKARDTLLQDEYIAEVTSTTGAAATFNVTSYAFNPGQTATFPRFAREAVLYEKWICTSAEFYYKPQVSQFATAGTTGKVMLSFDYDANDAAPSAKVQVEDTDPHADGMPWQNITLKLDPKELNSGETGKFVRPSGLPGGADIRLYDGGRLHVSTTGITNGGANVTLGELRVRYRFSLHKPVLENTTGVPQNFHTTQYYSSSNQSLTTSTAATLLVPTVMTNGLGASNTSGSITLPAGNYIVTGSMTVTSSGAISDSLLHMWVDGATTGVSGYDTGAGLYNTVSVANFVTSNGSTTVALRATVVSAGTITAQGNIIIYAV